MKIENLVVSIAINYALNALRELGASSAAESNLDSKELIENCNYGDSLSASAARVADRASIMRHNKHSRAYCSLARS